MDDFGAEGENQQDNEASASNRRKRGRPKLNPEDRHANKIQGCRDYRIRKKEEGGALKERVEALEEEKKEKQSNIDSLQEELSKSKALADGLGGQLTDVSTKLKEAIVAYERLESKMQVLQQKFLNQVHCEENLDIPRDDPDRNKILEGFTENSDPLWSKTPGPLSGEGTSIGQSPLVETVNVEGFMVLKENSAIIQNIFSRYPNLASDFKVRRLATKSFFIHTLAEVLDMAKEEEPTLGEIKDMEEAIADWELAGLNIPSLRTLVAKRREEVEVKEEIKNTEAELKKKRSNIAEDCKAMRRRFFF
ncbi:hypothetical protein PTKIN_Ptkin12aG0016000 [Pterospermum kingtungense]